MVEQFRNDTGHGIDIPRFGIYAPAGEVFTVPDEDNGSLNDDPGITNLGNATIVSVTDQGDGTFTVTGSTAADIGNGTFTTTGTATDNGDGTFTLAA